jgi:ATP-dependent RNA helicase DeaD
VQAQAIGAALEGRHVVMHSGTGTGKTLAYLLPVLQLLKENPDFRAVVFAPGPELAMQTLRVANAYRDPSVITGAAISTTNKRRQRKKITRGTRLIVGTPGRLLTMFEEGKLKGVRLMVFDELDPILASRRAEFLHELLSRSEPKRQLLVATATLGDRSEAFIERFMADGLRISTSERTLELAISHHVVRVPSGRAKDVALARFIQENRCRRVIVFATEPRLHSHLYHYLIERDLTVARVTLEGSKGQREQGLRAFREGRARVLLTTDAIARGIDFHEVDWVLHYDLPKPPEGYVHRAGRTGRAGKTGHSVVFADARMHGALRRLSERLDLEFLPYSGRTSGGSGGRR